MDVEESPWADSSQNTQLSSQNDLTSSKASSSPSHPTTSSSARPSRGPRRLAAQPTRLEAVDDPLGPLSAGPLDDAATQDEPPAPPQKEQMVIRTTMSPSQQQTPTRRPIEPHGVDIEEAGIGARGPRAPPPVDAAQPTGVKSSTQPSVSVEDAAKPSFHITVGDPVKIGDLTSSHIVYSVRTKVSRINIPLHTRGIADMDVFRQAREPISNPNSKSSAVTAISCGFITPYTQTTPVLLYHHHLTSRPSDASTVTLSRREERRSRRC